MQQYFEGERLYGDDFTSEQIQEWFRDEELAYYDLGASERANYQYSYHALNQYHGFRHLPPGKFNAVLGIGSAYGDEFRPILDRISSLTMLEPAPGFQSQTLAGIPCDYVRPDPMGDLPFATNKFDLVTCLGVLHHIPNVTKVVREIQRCTTPGGFVLLREPVISMGDWRRPRPGLTKRERGIPLRLLRETINRAGFRVMREARCFFPIIPRMRHFMKAPVFNSEPCVRLDALLCNLPWPTRYHATNVLQKFRPWAVYYVLQKPACPESS